MFVCFLMGWGLGGFAVYSYLMLSARAEPCETEYEEDDSMEQPERLAA